MPVVLFEPPKAIGMTLPGGSIQEMQAEAIIQFGFSRHRLVTALEHLQVGRVGLERTTGGYENYGPMHRAH